MQIGKYEDNEKKERGVKDCASVIKLSSAFFFRVVVAISVVSVVITFFSMLLCLDCSCL